MLLHSKMELRTTPTTDVPQRVGEHGKDFYNLSFVRISDFEKTWHVSQTIDGPYEATQELPTCKWMVAGSAPRRRF